MQKQKKKLRIHEISAYKSNNANGRAVNAKKPLVCLTSYTAPFAKAIDQHVDIILVGDSVGMVLYGMKNTLSVTLDMMIAHGKAVTSAASSSMVIVDMPFGSYQKSKESAYENAARVMTETGCTGVKIEGGSEMAETIEFLVQRGIPVMGHIGLMPQHFNTYGGFHHRGQKKQEQEKVIKDAKQVEKSGAFSIVIEGVTEKLAREVTKAVRIPTIGIGASSKCDGQILVTEDLVGLNNGHIPKFVKKYDDLFKNVEQAAAKFASDVKSRKFPTKNHCF